MISIVFGSDRNKYPEIFGRLFKLRYEVFIVNREWSLPWKNGAEVDQYDTNEAIYLYDAAENGEIFAHIRLTPTLQASLIADYFPHLVENGESPRGPAIYEGTRFMILPTQRDKSQYRFVKARFMAAVIQWCLDNGVSHVQTVIDSGTLASYVEVSMLVTPMGLSFPFGGGRSVRGGGECLAFRMPICSELLDDIKEYGSLGEQSDVWCARPLELA